MLKNVLSLLLSRFYSKREAELVAHQSFPGQESQTLLYGKEVDSWATVGTGIAPFDGYLQLKAKGKAIDGIVGVSGSTVTTAVQFPWPTATVTGWTKVAKGQTWSVEGSGAQNISLIIFKTIGGGYLALKNSLLQGGVICLSNLYSSLRRSSWLARRNGCSKTLSPLTGAQLLSQIKGRVFHPLRTLLRQTDCLGFGTKQVRGIALHCLAIATVTEVTQQDGNFLRLTDGQLKTLFMYLRERSSSLIQTATRQVLPECGSIRRLNFALGGPSC